MGTSSLAVQFSSSNDTTEILANREIAIAAGDVPETAHVPGMHYGLLGLEMEQAIIRLQTGAVKPQVSRKVGIQAAESLVILVQLAPFHGLVIYEIAVGRCIAYRATDRQGSAVFIDGRRVGKPVCKYVVN